MASSGEKNSNVDILTGQIIQSVTITLIMTIYKQEESLIRTCEESERS